MATQQATTAEVRRLLATKRAVSSTLGRDIGVSPWLVPDGIRNAFGHEKPVGRRDQLEVVQPVQ
jgi:hypothetical protein